MNPILGVFYHWLGGLAAGSFYLPYRGVRNWSWETYWLVGGFFSWIIMPWLLASVLTRDLLHVLTMQPASVLFWTYFFGVLWGMGGLTFGLTMRYLGISLGMGVALGFCAALGTLLPPIFKLFMPTIPVAETLSEIASNTPGRITLAGVAVCLIGIAISALAGLRKEKELPADEKKKAIAEFAFGKGIAVATFSGVMSACFAFALTAGNPIGEASAAAGTDPIWSGLPKLVVVLLGGFTTNFIACVTMNLRNRSGYQYLARTVRPEHAGVASGGEHGGGVSSRTGADLTVPRASNYLLSALAGTTWYFQFFFYTMGESQMGRFGFSSWTIHMASIIIFSTLWGVMLKEWRGTSRRCHELIGAGIATLVLSTLVVGYGNYLAATK